MKQRNIASGEERFRAVVENAPLCIHEIDCSGLFLGMNPAGLALLGLNEESEIQGLNYLEFVHDQDRKRVEALLKSAVAGSPEHFEFRLARPGRALTFDSSFIPIKNADGEVSKLIGVSQDISQQRDYEEQLKASLRDAEQARQRIADQASELAEAHELAKAANETKNQFLSNMSHELRTPLNGVMGILELLNDTDLSPEQTSLIETAQQSSNVLIGIVNDILDFSKSEAGELTIHEAGFELRSFLAELEALVVPSAAEKYIAFHIDVDQGTSDRIWGDAHRLRQVLLNLVGNAIKFTNNGGEVSISVGEVPQDDGIRLRFAVTDSGIGIDRRSIPGLFGKFVQGDPSSTRLHGGTGIGLTICAMLIELMGGEIEVESEVGAGSVFSFSIRVRAWKEEEDGKSVAPSAPDTPASSRPATVLLVEDNPVNQKIATQLLTKAGHDVTLACDGQQAIDLHARHQFDVIFMDVQMPNVDGIEATHVIREREAAGHIRTPIVALTAHAMAGDRATCLAAGMDEHLTKPFRRAELLAMLENVRGLRSRS